MNIIQIKKMRQLLSILMLTLTLVGVQVVKASPLHDHLSHVAGCVFCHGDANEAGLISPTSTLNTNKFKQACIPYPSQSLVSHTDFFFHSRAPPLFFI